MPRVPGDVPQVSFQPTQMPGYSSPAVQPAQNFFPQQLQQLAAGVQDLGQASSRIGASMQREELAEQERQKERRVLQDREKDKHNDTITGEKLLQYRVEINKYADDFSKMEGVSARDGFPDRMKGFDEINKKYSEFFQDPVQKQLWENKSILYREQTRLDIANHAQGQAKIVEKANLSESIKLSRLDYSKAVGMQLASETMPAMTGKGPLIAPDAHKAVVVDSVKRLHEGMEEGFIKSKINTELQGLHKETVSGMIGLFQPKDIMSYLEKNKDEISPEYYAEMKATLQKSDRVAAAKAEATQIAGSLAVTEIDGVKLLDEGAVAAFIAKEREERAKRISNGEVIDEQYYDTRDSHLRQQASSDSKFATDRKAEWSNAMEQAFFEMSNSDYQTYDTDLNSGNALDKLEEKYPNVFFRGKELGMLGKVTEYARKTEFGAKSDPSTFAMAKAYVDQYGKTADKSLFLAQYGEGLSADDKRRLLTSIDIEQGKADEKQVAEGVANNSIDRLLDDMKITLDGKFNNDNTYGLTEEQHYSVQYQLKGQWEEIVRRKRLPDGMSENKYFSQWLDEKKAELTENGGMTYKMARTAKPGVSGPNYYTSRLNNKTYDINDIDIDNVQAVTRELEKRNEKRFYVSYYDANGELKIEKEYYGNPADASTAADLIKKSKDPKFYGAKDIMVKERPYKAYVGNEPEVLQAAVDRAIVMGEDPNINNRMNAIARYDVAFVGTKREVEASKYRAMRQRLVDGAYDREQIITEQEAAIITGLDPSRFAAYKITPSGFISGTSEYDIGVTYASQYKLSDLEPAITDSFKRAVRSKK
jgi:hypothetical protein